MFGVNFNWKGRGGEEQTKLRQCQNYSPNLSLSYVHLTQVWANTLEKGT